MPCLGPLDSYFAHASNELVEGLLILYGPLLLFSCQVMSDTVQPHGLQHDRLPCPGLVSPSPGVCSNSRQLSQWCHPTISSSAAPSHPALNLSFPALFQWIGHIRWPKYWSFSFNISPSNEYSGLISFTIDWFDLFAVQGTLKSLLQHHSSKASILLCSAFFMVQLSSLVKETEIYLYMLTWRHVQEILLWNMKCSTH